MGASLASGKYKIKWSKFSELPVPMREAYATIIDDVIYIGGGVCPNRDDQHYIFMYHLKEKKWNKLPSRLPQHNGVVVNINNKLTVIGGNLLNNGDPTNTVLTLSHQQWSPLFGNMNRARVRPVVASHKQSTIIAGGKCHGDIVLDSIEVLNTNTNQWTTSKACLPQPMWAINGTSCNGSLVITGYYGQDSRRYNGAFITSMDNLIDLSVTHSTSTKDGKWIQLTDTPYWRTTIVPHTTPPVILGGQDEQLNTTDDIMAYDDSTNSWRTVASLPMKCCYTTTLLHHDAIIFGGGITNARILETRDATSLTSMMIGNIVECS